MNDTVIASLLSFLISEGFLGGISELILAGDHWYQGNANKVESIEKQRWTNREIYLPM